MNVFLQVWFQNRRAKFRKRENTKKGPGRPAHNAQPQTCSGEPISQDELLRKEANRRERKLMKQLEKQQKKLAAKGIHVDIDSLRKDYDAQKAGGGNGSGIGGGNGKFDHHHFDARSVDAEIDVVGDDDDDLDDLPPSVTATPNAAAAVAAAAAGNALSMMFPPVQSTAAEMTESDTHARKKVTAFSIESLLKSSVQAVQAAAAQQHQQQIQRQSRKANPPVKLKRSYEEESVSNQGSENNHQSPPSSPAEAKPDSKMETDQEEESKKESGEAFSPPPSPARDSLTPLQQFSAASLLFQNHAAAFTAARAAVAANVSLLKPLTAAPEKSPLFQSIQSHADDSLASDDSGPASPGSRHNDESSINKNESEM